MCSFIWLVGCAEYTIGGGGGGMRGWFRFAVFTRKEGKMKKDSRERERGQAIWKQSIDIKGTAGRKKFFKGEGLKQFTSQRRSAERKLQARRVFCGLGGQGGKGMW